MTSPAEKLAAKKPWRRAPRNGKYLRKTPWDCKLREVREALRISLRDVALAVKMSGTALWQLEHGTDPMLSTARKLATFYGKPIDELWPRMRKAKA